MGGSRGKAQHAWEAEREVNSGVVRRRDARRERGGWEMEARANGHKQNPFRSLKKKKKKEKQKTKPKKKKKKKKKKNKKKKKKKHTQTSKQGCSAGTTIRWFPIGRRVSNT